MHTPFESVTLRALTPREASDITAGNRPLEGWTEDFPGEGDVIAARYTRGESTVDAPWRSSWLILVDGLVAGTVGFKGEPIDHRLDVGYGVVPSRRGQGVATAALAQLLAMVEERDLTIRAETATSNVASEMVLRHFGFTEVARRVDLEDVDLIVWERARFGPAPRR
ncbi:MAG TPA: GNAT family N-acetyltransferase [Acidimicrobiales bacterium]|jgi:RimJ/RimL family protein N-acetyltransferase|nr:GNAT family N-acetyltransferase [Acidimicrobiales bacterium]